LIADDHTLVRDGLCRLVDSDPNLEIVGVASSGGEAIRLLQASAPDLLLVDLNMPDINGIEVIRAARRLNSGIRSLAFTAYASSSYVYSALKAGAIGYVVKTESGTDILRAIFCALDNLSYLSPEVTHEVVTGYVRNARDKDASPLDDLTGRERELFDLIATKTVSNKALANSLFVSEKTIQRHKTNLFRKLGVTDTQDLLRKIKANGWDGSVESAMEMS